MPGEGESIKLYIEYDSHSQKSVMNVYLAIYGDMRIDFESRNSASLSIFVHANSWLMKKVHPSNDILLTESHLLMPKELQCCIIIRMNKTES